VSTTNFNKFKEKLEKSKAKKATSNFTWMKLDSGKHYTMRFLPLKSENLELPVAIYNHHALNFPDGHFESVACPRASEERECPFCGLASQTYRKFTKTENKEYLEAAKKLFVKTHYLLVGYEPNEIDTSDIKTEDLKIVRASSATNMDLIKNKLEREIDFVDFATGRNVDLSKTKKAGKDAYATITWDFDDPSVAFEGKSGKKIWEDLIDKSPDLTSIITPLTDAELDKKFKDFMSTPIEEDEKEEVDESEAERKMLQKYQKPVEDKLPVKNSKPIEVEDVPFDLEDLKRAMED